MANQHYYTVGVLSHLQSYFEAKLAENKDTVRVVSRSPFFNGKYESVIYYLLAAEEGVIDPKYEFKPSKDRG